MLVNGLTRQGTANDGTLSTVRDALSPFAVVEIIIAVLRYNEEL